MTDETIGGDWNKRGSREKKAGEQTTGVISLLSSQAVSRLRQGGVCKTVDSLPDNLLAAGGLTDEKPPQWLKAVLPEANHGWWDVYLKGSGLAVKFCWRAGGLQKLSFPRIDLSQFQNLKQKTSGEVKEILRAQIAEHLQSLLCDRAKRGKALAAAEKLDIDLDVYTVNTLTAQEL